MSDAALEQGEQQVSRPYELVMGGQTVTYHFPASDDFITFKHPGLGEDDIQAALDPGAYAKVSPDTIRKIQAGKAVSDDIEAHVSQVPRKSAAFHEKLKRQTVDYAVTWRVDGRLQRFTYSERNGGDNEYNNKVYTAMLELPIVVIEGETHNLRQEVEEAADIAAGRVAPAQEDMAALGEGPSE